jgi:transmembrane sensor
MSNIRQLPGNQVSYDSASDWIVKLDRGLTADEEIALQEWLQADTQNHDVLMEMTRLWDKMDAMTRLTGLFPTPAKPKLSKPRHLWQTYSAIAASFVLATMLGVWALLGDSLFSDRLGDNVYQTAIGEQSNIMLPDGTKIVLNTNSKLEVSYSNNARILQLHQGELNVSVAKDPSRPLSVIAAGQIIQAIGTEFNIEITDQQKIELVVTEGKVKVGVQNPSEKPTSNPEPQFLSVDARTVSAGEKLMLGDSNEAITEVSADDIAVKLSWRSGNLIFRGESLEEAVKEVGRYTSVEFVFMNEDLKKMRVAGLFKAGDVEGLLATLRENFDIVTHRDDDGKVLLSID